VFPKDNMYLSESITADSIPDQDDWGIDSYWSCEQWQRWHYLNRHKYGLHVANQKFSDEWSKGTFGAANADCATFNDAFKRYINRTPGLYDIVWGEIYLAPVLQPASSGLSVVTNASKGLQTTAQAMRWVVPMLASIAIVGGGIYAYRKLSK